jgi:CopA family copper-resistance protein
MGDADTRWTFLNPFLSRRRFIQWAGAVGTSAALGYPLVGRTQPRSCVPSSLEVLDADRGPVDLRITRKRGSIGGRRGEALTINGTIPGPLLRMREGGDVEIRVHNALDEDTSVHWHGVLVPNPMDGVPGLNFPGIKPGETFVYRFPVRQYGTYWYHAHSAFQEQQGHYGPLVIAPRTPPPYSFDREHVLVLSDWTFEDPHRLFRKLKTQAGYYNRRRRTLADFWRDSATSGVGPTLRDRVEWGRMRMDPTDISDVTGFTYT